MITPTNELIKKSFNFLADEYGYSIDREKYSPEAMGNAYVLYKSQSVGIKVVVDRSQVLINIGDLSWPEENWFEFGDVVQFFNPEMKEVYDFSRGSLDNQAYIESQAKRLARILRQYCKPMLRGDFSMQDDIKEIEKKRVTAMLEHFQKLSRNHKRTTG
jgi:hypothetical protein